MWRTGPLRARDVCEVLDRELLRKNIERTLAKLKRPVKLGILTEIDTGSFARKRQQTKARDQPGMDHAPPTSGPRR